MLPILTKTLSIEEYGIWVQLEVTVLLIQSFTNIGLSYTMLRFLAGSEDKDYIQETFYSILFLILSTNLLASFIIIVFSKIISSTIFDGNINITFLLAIIIIIGSLNGLFLNFYRTFEEIKKYSLFIIVQKYLALFLVTLLILVGYGIVGAVIGLLISNMLLFIVMFYLILRNIGFKKPNFEHIKEYFSFGLPIIPEYLSSWIINSSDRYLITIFLGITATAYYAPSYTLGNMLLLCLSPISFILPPALYKNYELGNMDVVKTVLKYSLKYFLAIAIPAFFVLSVLSKEILVLLTTEEIALNAYYITPLVALSAILFGVHAICVEVIFLKKKTRITGMMWIISAFINFGLNLILIPYFGLWGAAITTLIAFLFAFIITLYYSNKWLKFDFDVIFIIKSIIASLILVAIIYILNPSGIFNIIFTLVFSFVVYLVLLVLLKGFQIEEINFFKNLIK